MHNSPSQMIPDMHDWGQIWGSGRLRKSNSTVHFPRALHPSKRRRRWVGVKDSRRNGRRDPKCTSVRHLRMVREDTGAPSEVLPVTGWRPMKQLAVRVHFLRCGGILDDWSVEGILSLVFV
ncbi:uncharacterized protein TNCV_3638381 [Trichonephila clavipes]|nr:uncharacterized protein TNCV_3638381 [Trichonephila clavipes]